ncbi:peptidoglycan DD-metalloendopeptidase family protein [Sphingomonas sp. RB56-2]|uniref:Peptidoglycan DD-metalloendopeptidase family protein n=1 Tax=Sphingomonas brevis TaxID=2908206 RepID=A0ABT0SCF9_9SPHN|nr:peptidoglycan DD-metalloendopeptidase family protein [Sphingomonas brevis]MCL6742033.1 peptidoglycan DD-metalloendopeptidase family protein [Sphingomonas brevis]
MMRGLSILLLAIAPVVVAASAPVAPVGPSANSRLAEAEAEAKAAATRLQALESQAGKAKSEADRLRAEQVAAAAAIEEAEARISESGARLQLARAEAALAEQRLADRRAPLAALLAGLATMGRQPPLLALADRGSIDELVRVKALLDATMPVIERRSAALKGELDQRRKSVEAAAGARDDLAKSRAELSRRQQRFAELETRAADRAGQLAGEAFGAGDRLLVSNEALSSAGVEAVERHAALRSAADTAALGLAPPRPMRGDSALPPSDFAYSLPVGAPLTDGLGSISGAGIISRGLKFDTARGAQVIAPADGEILFAAPYRGQDGLVIIDHGNGWTSLLLGVASDKPKGARIVRGEYLGRALGSVGVELRRNGLPVSPALIAASSVPLSNSGDKR